MQVTFTLLLVALVVLMVLAFLLAVSLVERGCAERPGSPPLTGQGGVPTGDPLWTVQESASAYLTAG